LDGDTPLDLAIIADNVERVRRLVALGANVNAKDSHGNNALHIASYNHAVQCVPYLLDAGVKIDEKNVRGNIPHHIANHKIRRLIDEYNGDILVIKGVYEYN